MRAATYCRLPSQKRASDVVQGPAALRRKTIHGKKKEEKKKTFIRVFTQSVSFSRVGFGYILNPCEILPTAFFSILLSVQIRAAQSLFYNLYRRRCCSSSFWYFMIFEEEKCFFFSLLSLSLSFLLVQEKRTFCNWDIFFFPDFFEMLREKYSNEKLR